MTMRDDDEILNDAERLLAETEASVNPRGQAEAWGAELDRKEMSYTLAKPNCE